MTDGLFTTERNGDIAINDARDAVARVLASPAFRASRRSRDFLTYVVNETIAGRAGSLSERTVGRAALSRPDLFDGRLDSSVRVQATRVRKSLEEYYATIGALDPIHLVLPKGSYAVQFIAAPSTGAQGLHCEVVVVSFTGPDGSDSPLAERLTAEVIAALTPMPWINVRHSAQEPGGGTRSASTFTYVLTGSVQGDATSVVVSARLRVQQTLEILWTSTHPYVSEPTQSVAAQTWAQRSASEVGDLVGAVIRHELRRLDGSTLNALTEGQLLYCRYLQHGDLQVLKAAQQMLDEAVSNGAEDPAALSMLSSALVIAGAYDPTSRDELHSRASEFARRALDLDPRQSQPHLVLCTVAEFKQQWDLGRTHASTAATITPASAAIQMTAATHLSNCGDWRAGAVLAHRALELNPHLPGYMHSLIAFGNLMDGDFNAALRHANLIHLPQQAFGPLYRSLALDGLGFTDEANSEMREAIRIEPALAANPAEFVASNAHYEPADLAEFVGRIERVTARVA